MLFSRYLYIYPRLLLAAIFFSGLSSVGIANAYGEDPYFKSLVINGDSVIDLPVDKEIVLDFRHHNIMVVLDDADSTVFQYFLEGFDKDWSEWLKADFKEYTNLPAGNYKLHVRYIYKGSTAGELPELTFRVLPLWYFSSLAIGFYICFAAIIIWTFYASLNLRFAKTQYMLEQIINTRTEDLIIEKEKTEKLLANVLPKNTASEIMETGKATKMKYNFVTVLFSDIQGFTKIAEETNPEVLIDELDKFFFHFDSVVESLGIEKIKTIGDAYMCAGGIPEKNRTNPVEVILAALEMQSYMSRLKEQTDLEGLKFWDIRIGIHTGTVVAGVVGHKKLSYDIWGDTVNTASRMESSGEAGKINISGTTYEFVKDFFICEHRGKMPVKYKGELDMYFVKGIIPELRDEHGMPNRKFIIKLQMIKLQDIEEVVIKMFDDEAPPNLYFHNTSQIKNITGQAELLATAEGLSDEEFVPMKLAAIFMYSGYISDYRKPLEATFMLVEEILVRYGFEKNEIEAVRGIIANSFNNVYESVIDKILHDARYDYLGRVDYIKLTEKLYREESEYGIIHSKEEWIEVQRQLLIGHEFLTETGRLLRSIPLEDQIAAIQATVD